MERRCKGGVNIEAALEYLLSAKMPQLAVGQRATAVCVGHANLILRRFACRASFEATSTEVKKERQTTARGVCTRIFTASVKMYATGLSLASGERSSVAHANLATPVAL